MNCHDVENLLQLERDGALDERDRASLATHVSGCAHCRELQAKLTTVASLLHEESVQLRTPDPMIEWRKLQRTLHAEPRPAWAGWFRWLTLPAAIGAAAALALYVQPGSDPESQPKERLVRVEAVREPSAIVYVDDRSGWTFVWASDPVPAGQTRI